MDFFMPSQAVAASARIRPAPAPATAPSMTMTTATATGDESEDHILWQSSQSAPLKHLLHTPEDGLRLSRGWQRQSSFDQIPGFSRLSTKDASTPSSSSRPAVRPRRSNSNSPAVTSVSSPSEVPFTVDSNQLVHLMKDVSARLDQNVPVRSRSSLGPDRTKTDRRTRSAVMPFPSSRPAKKSHIERSRSGDTGDFQSPLDDKGKGKGKAIPCPDLDVDFDFSNPNPSQEFTPSQLQMPPPPGPSSKSTFPSSVRPGVPISSKQPHLPPATRTTPTPAYVPRIKPELPRGQTSSTLKPPSSGDNHINKPPHVVPDRRPIQKPAVIQKPAAAPSYTHTATAPAPQAPSGSQPTSRPPSLGMRRTNTFPMSTSLQKNGALPTRQKGFKPPLLSGSQPQMHPQPQTQHHPHPQPSSQLRVSTTNIHININTTSTSMSTSTNTSTVPRASGFNTGTRSLSSSSSCSSNAESPSASASASSSSSYSSSAGTTYSSAGTTYSSGTTYSPGTAYSSAGTSVSSRSTTRSSASPAPPGPPFDKNPQAPLHPPPRAAWAKSLSASSVPANPSTSTSSTSTSAKGTDKIPSTDEAVDATLPEPPDGDPDSSFGDMSFDIDPAALEETMRMYD